MRWYCLAIYGFLVLGAMEVLAKSTIPEPGFVGSERCAGCHGDEASAWRKSHHANAWTEPRETTVLGNFDDTAFEHKGGTTHFTRRGGKYFVKTEGPDGMVQEYVVRGVVGVAPLQQYLVETEPGRLQALDVAWDVEKQRWFHLYPDDVLPPGNGLHWTGPYKNWNARCAECHATGYDKGFDVRTKSYTSTQAEIGVGCEACHGPGEAHLDWGKAPKTFKTAKWAAVDERGLTIAPANSDKINESQQCASCHSRREPLGASAPHAGAAFDDNYRLALLRDGLYYPDGQILDEVYVYGSFLQSKMLAKGVRCSNCHEPHSGRLRFTGNGLCTQCHSPNGNSNFPSLRKALYDSPEHHFHKKEKSGAACVNCHMPERLYMVIDGRRDHSFRVPRPDLSEKIETPNACTGCHDDKSNSWASLEIKKRFPDGRLDKPHYGEVIAAARSGINERVQEKLLDLAGNRNAPGIVRATALVLLKNGGNSRVADSATKFLSDENSLIRTAAIPLQRFAPLAKRIRRLAPLLEDKLKVIRTETARALLGTPVRSLSSETADALRSAMREYQGSLLAKTDFPEGQMVIAGTALVLRNLPAAEQAFAEAITLDPQLTRAWLMLGRIQAVRGNPVASEKTLRRAAIAIPDESAIYHRLGGVLAQRGEREGAIEALQKATALAPDNGAIQSDLGILLSRLGRHEQAVAILERAETSKALSPELLYALMVSRLATGENKAAELTRTKLKIYFPASPANNRAQRAGR